MNLSRFQDNGETIDIFRDKFLVRCPNCNSCAIVYRVAPQDCFSQARFSCKHCGLSRDRVKENSYQPSRDRVTDDYFFYPLWLQTSCCGEILWANNLPHLEFLEAFIIADLRESKQNNRYDRLNDTIASKLPKWMKSRQNREKIRKSIAKMKQSLI
jgi:hypothetical protein